MNNSQVREPLFHIVKRDTIKKGYIVIIYAVAVIVALFIGGVICSISAEGDPFSFFISLFEGTLGNEMNIWSFLYKIALLLSVSMALVPAFKMKFWNLGANGQILIGALACTAVMQYLGVEKQGSISDGVLIPIMLVASVLAGMIWAVIPSVFKVLFNANETLFTLMMNYIAECIVTLFIAIWVTGGSGTLDNIPYGNLPDIGNQYVLVILVGIVLTVAISIYLKYTKHGYELSIVGESSNTARYIGVDVKKVVIRTLLLSGAICGVVGFLLVAGGKTHTVGVNTANNMGFTAIMTTWLANCNPIFIVLTCILVVFVTKGMEQVRIDFCMRNDSLTNLVVGIIYFFIIACAFFIKYRIVFRKKGLKGEIK